MTDRNTKVYPIIFDKTACNWNLSQNQAAVRWRARFWDRILQFFRLFSPAEPQISRLLSYQSHYFPKFEKKFLTFGEISYILIEIRLTFTL
jgi:hypothetical protein